MLGQIFGAFVVILFAVFLLPSITQQISTIATNISSDDSLSGFASATLLGIVPVLFTMSILCIAIAVAYTAFRSAGILGDVDDYIDEEEEPEEKPQKPHKQTYLEYVKERREIERLMKS
jgi:hypothetical protein